MHLSKALFSLDPDNLQLHCFLGLGALFCSFFCPLDQPCKTLQTVHAAPWPEINIDTELRLFQRYVIPLAGQWIERGSDASKYRNEFNAVKAYR